MPHSRVGHKGEDEAGWASFIPASRFRTTQSVGVYSRTHRWYIYRCGKTNNTPSFLSLPRRRPVMDQLLAPPRPPQPLPAPDSSIIPSIVLIAPPPPMNQKATPSLCDAWRAAFSDLPREVAARFPVKEARFNPTALAQEFGAFDCVVSPANTFGFLDGG